jgi:hypothetical protein
MTTVQSATANSLPSGVLSRIGRHGGAWCLGSGVAGLVLGVLLAVIPSHVSDERYSYPLHPGPFVVFQILFAVQHVLLLPGLLALRRSGAAGDGRLERAGLGLAFLGLVALTGVELAAISLAHAAEDSSSSDLFGNLYGITSLVTGLGLVLAGVGILRARVWGGAVRFVVLAAGVYIFVVLTPAGFGPVRVMSLAIGGWMLLWGFIGLATIRDAHQA